MNIAEAATPPDSQDQTPGALTAMAGACDPTSSTSRVNCPDEQGIKAAPDIVELKPEDASAVLRLEELLAKSKES